MYALWLLLTMAGVNLLPVEAGLPYPWYTTPKPTPAISQCNNDVMYAIKEKFWSKYGIPTNLVKTYIEFGKEIVWKTSKGYYPDKPLCAYSYFFQNYFTLIKESVYGYTSQESNNIIEVPGALYDEATEILRVIIIIRQGVSLVYTCSLADNAVAGPAQGLIKYKDPPGTDLDYAYFKATQDMQSVGISLTDEYGLSCPQA